MKLMTKDMMPNQHITTYFTLDSMRIRKSRKTGENFLSLTLQDKTGIITGYLWNDPASAAATLQEKSLVKVTGITAMINSPLIINIEDIREAERDEVDLKDFLGHRKHFIQQGLFVKT